MAKFEELCDAFNTALKDLDTYKEECRAFTKQLVDEMIGYFEIPQDNWRWVPYDRPPEPGVQYALGCAGLDGDGYWHAAVKLELWKKTSSRGSQHSMWN